MDVQEFKDKYPDRANLEDDALWNAMEDAWIVEHKNDTPKEVTDWMGNEIKEGQNLVIINVLEKHITVGWLIPAGISKSGKIEQVWNEPKPDESCWKIISEIKTIRNIKTMNELGYLDIQKEGDYTFYFYDTIENIIHFLGDTKILAIKGISDNEELYKNSLNK